MKVIQKIEEIRKVVGKERKEKVVGLVPTMGYFHQGHLSLMEKARKDCGLVVVSIYVNPTQFGPSEDFHKYPRNFKRDIELAEKAGVDLIFNPSDKEMYPDGYSTYLEVKGLSEKLCGAFRPEHFNGVVTIVNKLFNIISPDKAYFGWKDAQQLIIIKKMAKDLNMPVEVIGVPTVREKDGLACSSRNIYLSEEERKIAPILYESLQVVKKRIEEGERDSNVLLGEAIEFIHSTKGTKIQYLKIVSLNKLEELKEVKPPCLIAAAIFIGKTRLIDNLLIQS